MSHIELLNRRLGERLGRVCGGTRPRFQWCWGPDMPYWRNRLGNVWVLCGWQKPALSEAEWAREFEGRCPYPSGGMWHPYAETQLPVGVEPSEPLTAWLMHVLDEQMSRTFADHLSTVNEEMVADKAADDERWVEQVQDSAPAFNNWEYGTRAGAVSLPS